MLRYSLMCAAFLMSGPVVAEKIVNPDGDSFIEIEVAQNSVQETIVGVLNTLSPVSSAEASTFIPPADASLMHDAPSYNIEREFEGYYAEPK